MVVTLGQQYNVGERLTVILNTYIINYHAGPPNTTKAKDKTVHSLKGSCCCLKKNLNASRPSEHPPVIVRFLTVSVLVANTKKLLILHTPVALVAQR